MYISVSCKVDKHYSVESGILSKMGDYGEPSRKRYWDHLFVWNRNFTTRQYHLYFHEETSLTQYEGQSALAAFFNEQRTILDPPDHNFTELRAFLEKSNDSELLNTPSRFDAPMVLLDDRQDTTGWRDAHGTWHSARNSEGYASYPPEGERIESRLLSPGDLYRKLLTKVRAP